MIKYVIFDLDGTIVDSAPDVIWAMQQALTPFTEYADLKVTSSVIGSPLDEMFVSLIPGVNQHRLELLVRRFQDFYDNCGYNLTTVYPAIRELIRLLQEERVLIYLVTNKRTAPTKRLIAKFKLDCFEEVIAQDSEGGRLLTKPEMVKCLLAKRRLAGENVILVGDASSDVAAAKQNGILSLAVRYGYGDRAELEGSRPDFIVDKPNQIIGIIKEANNEP